MRTAARTASEGAELAGEGAPAAAWISLRSMATRPGPSRRRDRQGDVPLQNKERRPAGAGDGDDELAGSQTIGRKVERAVPE